MRITMLERATGRTGVTTSLARAGHRITVATVVGSADPLCANAHRSDPKAPSGSRTSRHNAGARVEARFVPTRHGVFRWEIENGESPATKDRLRSIVPASRLGDPSPCR